MNSWYGRTHASILDTSYSPISVINSGGGYQIMRSMAVSWELDEAEHRD